MKKINLKQYISLRTDIEIKINELEKTNEETKVFLENKEIADIELNSQSRPVLQAILPLLDGSRTAASIIVGLKKLGMSEKGILLCLDFLLQSGFIFQFTHMQDIYQAASYAWRTNNAQEILDKIARAKVLLQGQKIFCECIANGLGGTGIQTIQIFDTLKDSINTDSVDRTNQDQTKNLQESLLHTAEWKASASEANLVISFNESWKQVLDISLWCMSNKKPLIVGCWKGFLVSFGPVFVPGVTACPACVNNYKGDPFPVNFEPNKIQAGSYPMISCAANLLAGICVEFLSEASLSRILTSIHELDLRYASFRVYPAIKNPRCKICGRLNTYPEGTAINA